MKSKKAIHSEEMTDQTSLDLCLLDAWLILLGDARIALYLEPKFTLTLLAGSSHLASS
jgi:hypothetical protein